MSSLRKTSRPYRIPIENGNLAKCGSYVDGPVKKGRIILRAVDLFWTQEDEEIVSQMWENGAQIVDIAESVQRDPDEVLILLIELGRAGKINGRDGGIYGRVELPGLIRRGRVYGGE